MSWGRAGAEQLYIMLTLFSAWRDPLPGDLFLTRQARQKKVSGRPVKVAQIWARNRYFVSQWSRWGVSLP